MKIGATAPEIDLQAVASGRRFDLLEFRGRHVLLIFVSAYEARSTREVVIAIRQQFPDFQQLPIAIVINLRPVPRLLRRTVNNFMEAAYREASIDVPPGFNPVDHLILLPDWTGTTTNIFGINHSEAKMYLVFVGPDGKITESFHGHDATDRAIDYLSNLFDSK